jgi:hypothetical protein
MGDRFFDVNVFVCPHGTQGDGGVPVMGSGDDAGVDVCVLKDVFVLRGPFGWLRLEA